MCSAGLLILLRRRLKSDHKLPLGMDRVRNSLLTAVIICLSIPLGLRGTGVSYARPEEAAQAHNGRIARCRWEQADVVTGE